MFKLKDIKSLEKEFNMDKIYKILIVLSFLVIISLGFSISSYSNTLSLSPDSISSQVIAGVTPIIMNGLEPRLDSIDEKLTDINNSLQVESESHFIDVINKVDDSVVAILTMKNNQSEKDNVNAVVFTDADGNDWFVGTGFSINSDGYILTANHVVGAAEEVLIVLKNGTIIPVNANVTSATNLDLAIIEIKTNLPPVDIIEDGMIDVGSNIGFIGFPLGLGIRTKTKGSISAVNLHKYSEEDIQVFIYVISSFVNYGNSGGPVFSLKTGKVVGVINQVDVSRAGVGISTIINKNLIPKKLLY